MNKKKYAVVGVSHRAFNMFMDEIVNTYKDRAKIVAMLDKDKTRMKAYNDSRDVNLPAYKPEEFDKMIHETKPDVVLVTCPDAVHHEYVIKALNYNLDVVVEKPLTIDEQKCGEIAAAQAKSKGKSGPSFQPFDEFIKKWPRTCG